MPDEFELLLDEFSTGTVLVKSSAFRRLIALRQHHKAIGNGRFKIGLENLLETVADTTNVEVDRLLAIATLGRIGSTIRGIRAEIHEMLLSVLITPLPDPSILEDVDDRNYVGQVCCIAPLSWVGSYAARAAVIEESGEQARLSFLIALLKSTTSLENALAILSEQLQAWVPGTEEPGNTVSKRLRRILAGLRTAIIESMPESGEDPGTALSKVVRASYANVSAPTNNDVLADTAEEVAGVVHEVVRLRFSLATYSTTYVALNAIQSIIPSEKWKKIAINSKMMIMVASDIAEAILVIARQGVTDSALVRQLGTASGGSESARERLREIAKNSGISPEIKSWLVEGKLEAPKSVIPDAGESKKLSDDTLLADLLVDACRYGSFDQAARQQVLPEFEILNPALANELTRVMNYAMGLCDTIAIIAKRRGLKVRGLPGDEDDYAPLDHEITGDASGVRRIRILRPVVDQIREDGIPFVVRKGIVEPLK